MSPEEAVRGWKDKSDKYAHWILFVKKLTEIQIGMFEVTESPRPNYYFFISYTLSGSATV